jgi:Arc/MetJ-type ribon-helix-helix transcriptional regulator
MTEYVTVRLPQAVTDDVDKLVGKHGFSSRAEIVKAALREFLPKYGVMEA